jgi:hypothetical protein
MNSKCIIRSLGVGASALVWALVTTLPTAHGQTIFSLDFSNPPDGEYTARGAGINAARTGYWPAGFSETVLDLGQVLANGRFWHAPSDQEIKQQGTTIR